MKKTRISIIVLAGLLIFGGCVKENLEAPAVRTVEAGSIDYDAPAFMAQAPVSDGTRTSIGTDKKITWTADDRISVFSASTTKLQYTFTGNTGDAAGTFNKIAGDYPEGASLSANYAVYPYSASNTINDEGVISVTLPSTQSYSQKSFGAGANIMTAVTSSSSSHNLQFKNAGGYFVVKLYGDATVERIVLTSTAGEKLSGGADIAFNAEGTPSLTMHTDASTSVTLDCGGVKLSNDASKPTDFWFVLPPTAISQGFEIQVVCSGSSFAHHITTSGSIRRNGIISSNSICVRTTPGAVVGLIKDPQIIDSDVILSLVGDKIEGLDIPDWLMEAAIGIINKNGDIKLYRVNYTTTDVDGNIVVASGMIAYPTSIPKTSYNPFSWDTSTAYDKIISVQHYTCDIEGETPSRLDAPVEMMVALKEGDNVVVLADYLGYGTSKTGDLQHPYIHNKLTGSACADLIEAAKDYVAKQGLTPGKNWKIDLIGYSQGGAATISTLLELERRNFTNIGDVYAGGGPHDLSVFLKRFLDSPDTPFRRTGFVAYLMRGLIYGERLDVDVHNIFAERVFTSGAYDKFSKLGVGSWSGLLGTNIRNLLHPDFFETDYNGNEDIKKFMEAVDRNSLVNFKPKNASKIVLYHSPNDDTVLYDCSVKAAEAWGCPLNDLEKTSHDDAGIEFYAKWFGSVHIPIIGDINVWDVAKDYL